MSTKKCLSILVRMMITYPLNLMECMAMGIALSTISICSTKISLSARRMIPPLCHCCSLASMWTLVARSRSKWRSWESWFYPPVPKKSSNDNDELAISNNLKIKWDHKNKQADIIYLELNRSYFLKIKF